MCLCTCCCWVFDWAFLKINLLCLDELHSLLVFRILASGSFDSVCTCTQVLGFDLLKSGIFSVLPWITMALAANLGGFIADSLVSRGVSVTTVRKVMQTV